MAHKTEIFLGKSGKIFGPFSEGELQKMMARGELTNYFWIWSSDEDKWKPLEPPPAHPYHSTEPSPYEQAEAVCYDHFNLAHGKVESITETGCQLIVRQKSSYPVFSLQGRAQLNLAFPHKKTTTLTPVQIVDIRVSDRKWIYTLRWAEKFRGAS